MNGETKWMTMKADRQVDRPMKQKNKKISSNIHTGKQREDKKTLRQKHVDRQITYR